jgi:hypothetical protein
MGQGGRRLLVVVAVGLATLAFAGSASASGNCGERVLNDWRDGRLDGTYPVNCYRQALATMPEDVRVYSSAEDDIARALQSRLDAHAVPASKSSGSGGGVSPLLVVAITAGLLVTAGSVATVLR